MKTNTCLWEKSTSQVKKNYPILSLLFNYAFSHAFASDRKNLFA